MTAALLFTNAQVFDGTGRPPFAGEVLVRGNRIEAVGEASARLDRQRAEVVDCGGATLMPGLVEAHAHLSWPSSVGRIIDAMVLPPEEHLLVTARNARVTLDAGFTSAYSAGSLGPRFEIALREEINGGWIPGPRLRASSLERLPDGALGLKAEEGAQHPRGPAAMRAYVREMAKAGVDSIKFLLSSDEGVHAGRLARASPTPKKRSPAIGDEARACGLFLACHAQAAQAVKLGAKHGFRILYHCSHADEEALDLLEEKKHELFVAPAIGLMYARTYEAADFGITRAVAEKLGAPFTLERMQTLYPKMTQARHPRPARRRLRLPLQPDRAQRARSATVRRAPWLHARPKRWSRRRSWAASSWDAASCSGSSSPAISPTSFSSTATRRATCAYCRIKPSWR